MIPDEVQILADEIYTKFYELVMQNKIYMSTDRIENGNAHTVRMNTFTIDSKDYTSFFEWHGDHWVLMHYNSDKRIWQCAWEGSKYEK